ncbi:unnamed protein product [Rotaria magnacalcarata]|uniref:Glycoside hydrolase family 65 central catalytic domain-containing protein n=3 Tax=Rotaria magnacalcarata TaxID=392030 RepID=A0A816H9G7_9BILA|nr:unnamed protein product [Rotaria magnacalcarata]CAF2057227.1 unnamed protein product [Rotaria magnacalcarata]
MSGTDAVGHDIAHIECGEDYGKECDIEELVAICNSNSSCRGFNSNGFLKSCTSGCDANCCYDVTQNVDLYIRKGFLPPDDWQNDVFSGRILFANPEPHFCFLPEIANGYIGTVAMSAALFQSGLFNGKCGNVGKARLPSPIGGSIITGELIASALHFEKAVFTRRYQFDDQNGAIIEHSVYISQTLKSVMVVEFSPVASTSKFVTFSYSSTFDPLNQTHNPETKCTGGGGVEIDVEFTLNSNLSTSSMYVYEGILLSRDDRDRLIYVTICTQQSKELNQTLTISSRIQFISTLASSIDFGPNPIDQMTVTLEAINRFDEALTKKNDLFNEHVQAWRNLWKSGIDIEPMNDQPFVIPRIVLDTDSNGENDTVITIFSRSLDIAQHVNSSMYYLLSSSRDDWPYGISPGGLASQSYSGLMFFDMDWYMMPALLPFYPSRAESLLRYRYNSLDASNNIALRFGYNGSMFAWTAAYLGRAEGCCDGKGGWELCIEQHITGDVAVAVQMYYYATKDDIWLENIGWPLLRDIAKFWSSRVTKTNNMTYSIEKVMPVDEWCDNDQTKCGDIGIDNAIQTNAVAIISLQLAKQVGDMFGFEVDPEWEIIAKKIKINFNSTTQTHIQWDNAVLPPAPSHYVCPEDVLYLTYPMNFNVTPAIIRNDAETFIPITCQENAGMTAPIHAIVWLMLNETLKAEGEFNRSLQACTYGEFHVRNEVDIHANIIGGHGFNTHFLTGDGGFIQSVMMGYAGLRYDDKSLLFNPLAGSLTPATKSIRLRNVHVRGAYPFDFTINQNSVQFICSDVYDNMLCIIDNHKIQWNITSNQLTLYFQDIHFPLRVDLCI